MKKGNSLKRTICIMVGFVLAAVFSQVIFARPASALDAKELQILIKGFNGGGLNADISGSDTITVTGATRDAAIGLSLNPDSGIIINWQAIITAKTSSPALAVKGNGVTFNLMPNAFIENKADNTGTALDIANPVKLNFSGGVIRGYTALKPVLNIHSDTKNATIFFFTGNSSVHDTIESDYPNLKGIVFEGRDGRVYGSVTLTQSLIIPEGYTLTIPKGTSLNNQGVIINNGKIVNNGSLTGKPVEGNGAGGGNGGNGEDGAAGCNAGIGIAGLCALGLWLTRNRVKKICR